MKKENICKIFVLILLIGWFIFLTTTKIDLITADLGRHLKTGELIFKRQLPIYTNFYSYTNPNFPVVNHHWGSGFIFFLIQKVSGFFGLSGFYLLLNLITFLLFFRLAQKNAGFGLAVFTSIFAIPLIAERKEIRPEIFSYFFSALFFWILWHFKNKSLSWRWLLILPFLEIFWVNLHIYFFLGQVLIGVFLFEAVILKIFRSQAKSEVKKLILIFVITILSALVNPYGLKELFYPLNIFKNYGYRIVENQSILFLEKLNFYNPNFIIFKITYLLFILSFIFVFIFNKKKFSISYFVIGLSFGLIAFFAIRNLTIFGFFIIPIISYNLKEGLFSKIKLDLLILTTVIFFMVNLIITPFLIFQSNNFGFGLKKDVNLSAEFFKKEKIQGPIFNNYDIGGYLIYHLFPKEKVYVDNRPEAYPADFFTKNYISVQNNNNKWFEIEKKYHFNAIFFSHRDYTPWGQNFLINRINDSSWAPVYADEYAIIFLKRNLKNDPIIKKYEIPKDKFNIKSVY
jgi:hypothetical protein